ncbi:hypothetical protein ACFL1H_07730, partial [Nanoarchaeota archaeon]
VKQGNFGVQAVIFIEEGYSHYRPELELVDDPFSIRYLQTIPIDNKVGRIDYLTKKNEKLRYKYPKLEGLQKTKCGNAIISIDKILRGLKNDNTD